LSLPLLLWRYGCRRGGMTVVMLDHSVVPMLLFTVHDHVCPIGGNGCRGRGPCGSSPCQRAPRVPRARQKYAKRVGRSRAYVVGVGRGGDCSRRGAGVRRFDDIMGTRARREASLSLGRFNSWHAINALGGVCLLLILDKHDEKGLYGRVRQVFHGFH
jgi:hypothetical protein